MKNQIFSIESTFWKSLAISEDEIWLSQKNVKSLEKFESAVQKTGLMKNAQAYPLSSIYEVSFNEGSESVKLNYKDEKGKDKKLKIGFGDKDLSNKFGTYLGETLKLSKSQTQESQLKHLLLNLLYLVLAIGGTIWLGTMEDTSQLAEGSTRRSRNKGAFVRLIVETLGQTGVFIVGGLISAYLAYQVYSRYNNPENELVYKRV